MSKFSLGVWITSIAASVIAGVNVNITTGVASFFLVMGLSYMFAGTVESLIKANKMNKDSK